MRNFSLISILIALAIGGILWQKTLVKSVPDRLPDPADYSSAIDDQNAVQNNSANCDETNQESPECAPESAEQSEMEEQRRQGRDVMMKSFDDKYDKYRKQIGGRP